jgi:3-oxoacyl-[acyl-carrier protein] reductase
MNDLLKGKCALVTGGTAGIGKAIALNFAKQGAKVAIFGTNLERGKQVLHELNLLTHDQNAQFVPVNVSQKSEVDSAIKKVMESFKNIDILVNNAGVTRDQLLMKMTENEWDDVMTINVKSCYNTSQALIRSMMKARGGKIINISSIVGLTGNAGQVNYAASKAAMIGFTKALAKEVASRGICVNCIAPGFIDTTMTEVLTDAQKNSILEKIPLGRMGRPDEIASVALFLASEMSSYMTGQVMTVDGGIVM